MRRPFPQKSVFLCGFLCDFQNLGIDNEMGYSNKVLDLIEHMYSVDHK